LPEFVHYIIYYGIYIPGTVLHISGVYGLQYIFSIVIWCNPYGNVATEIIKLT